MRSEILQLFLIHLAFQTGLNYIINKPWYSETFKKLYEDHLEKFCEINF
jgi:hypothetical protein